MDTDLYIRLIRDGEATCILVNGLREYRFSERGIRTLFRLYENEPETLRGAFIADKVVGKGAAALMVLGGAASVYADTLSEPALQMLQEAGLPTTFGQCVPRIKNRTGNDFCPVEKRCLDCTAAEECLTAIRKFMEEQDSGQ